jgi:Flp pilus assembly protein TadD/4-amino-4-deoxy-L-arabinose transferase-like glycosyltransferase
VLLGDAASYDSWAQSIAAGNWLGVGVFYQAPLYPYFLGTLYALFGRDLILVRVFQSLLGAIACVLMTTASARLFGRRAGIAAGLLLACYAPAIFFDGLLQKSVLDLLILCCLLFAVANLREQITSWRCIASGIAIGCLALTRENAFVLAPLILIWLWLRGQRALKPLLLVAAGIALVIGPVVARNTLVGGGLYLTTSQLGPNLYIGNNDYATGTYVSLRPGRGNAAYEQQDATKLAEEALGHELTPAEVSEYWRDRALEWISDHPGKAVRLTARKLLLVWNGTELVDTEDIASHAEYSLPLEMLGKIIYFGTVAPLGLLGMWMTRRRWRELWLFPAMCLVYSASTALFYVLDRYRYPLVPMLVPFAGVALAGLATWWKGTTLRERWSTVVVFAVVVLACNWPILSTASTRALTHFNVGSALQEQGRTEDAIAEYRAALALAPNEADAHTNLGALLAAQGEHDEAMRHYVEAIRLDPGSATAETNLGIELAARGRQVEALAAFQRAVDIDPTNASSAFNLGMEMAAMGDTAGAIRWLSESSRLDPKNAMAHSNLGVLLASAGRLSEAIEHLRAALAILPDDPRLKANLAQVEALAAKGR